MSQELASRHCEACVPGTPTVTEERAAELEAQLDPSWARDGTQRLRRELEFRNFRDAFGFVARLALLAESEGHHPDIELGGLLLGDRRRAWHAGLAVPAGQLLAHCRILLRPSARHKPGGYPVAACRRLLGHWLA